MNTQMNKQIKKETHVYMCICMYVYTYIQQLPRATDRGPSSRLPVLKSFGWKKRGFLLLSWKRCRHQGAHIQSSGLTKGVCNKGGLTRQGLMDTTELQAPWLQIPLKKPKQSQHQNLHLIVHSLGWLYICIYKYVYIYVYIPPPKIYTPPEPRPVERARAAWG